MPMPLPSQVHRCHLLPAPPHSPSLVTLLYSPLLNLFTPPPATTTTLYSGDIMFINTASFVAGAVVASPEQPAKLVRDQRRVVPGSCRARRGAASNGFRTYCMQVSNSANMKLSLHIYMLLLFWGVEKDQIKVFSFRHEILAKSAYSKFSEWFNFVVDMEPFHQQEVRGDVLPASPEREVHLQGDRVHHVQRMGPLPRVWQGTN